MSRKKIILLASFCLILALMVISLWVKPQTRASLEPRRYIWGYVTYEGTRKPGDEVGIYEAQEGDPLNTVDINEHAGGYRYRFLKPPSMEEGWYWVQGRGELTNSPWYHVYFESEFDIRQDLIMYPYEPDK